MSEHKQAQTTIAAYVAGGLKAEQRQRLEQHLAECPECADDVAAARALDRKLVALFSHANPGPALENRLLKVMQKLPPLSRNRPLRLSGKAMTIVGAAAAVLLALVGIGVNSALDEENSHGSPSASITESDKVIEKGALDDGESEADHKYASEATNGRKKFAGEGKGGKQNSAKKKEAPHEMREPQKPKIQFGESLPGPKPPVVDAPSAPAPNPPAAVGNGSTPITISGTNLTAGTTANFGGVTQTYTVNPQAVVGVSPAEPAKPYTPERFDPNRVFRDDEAKNGERKPPQDTPSNQKPQDTKPAPKWNDGLAKNNPADNFFGKNKNNPGDKGMPDPKDSQLPSAPPLQPPDLSIPPPTTLPPLPPPPAQDPQAKKEPSSKDDSGKGEQPPAPPKPAEEKQKDKKQGDGDQQPKEKDPQPAPQSTRKVIYTAELKFEVDSFDAASEIIMQLSSAAKGSFLGTINKEKLPNGRMRGIIVLRVPPELLQDLMGKLIKELAKKGELKDQNLSSEDVTKHYTDLESRLRGARAMEERLILMIKEGKGSIKDLLQAEKELGTWRTKIEEFEGELRYYASQVAHSTLTIKLEEREQHSAAVVVESERTQVGIETEQVEDAFNKLHAAVKALKDKARVTRLKLDRIGAGQYNAILHFEVVPELAGDMRERIRPLGHEARLQVDMIQQIEGVPLVDNFAAKIDNFAAKTPAGKVIRGPAQFHVSIYNVANMTPRESVIVRLAVANVRKEFDNLRALVDAEKSPSAGSVNDQDPDDIIAKLDFDVRKPSVAKIEAFLFGSGETLDRKGLLLPERSDVTESRIRYLVTLKDNDSLKPRETRIIRIVASDVPAAFNKLRQDVDKIKPRVFVELVNKEANKVSGNFDFSFLRDKDGIVKKALADAGDILQSNIELKPAGANLTDAKVLARVVLVSADAITPRDTFTFKIVTSDVARTYDELDKLTTDARVRFLKKPDLGPGPESRGEFQFELPSGDAAGMQKNLEKVVEKAGEIVVRDRSRAADGDDVTDARSRFLVELVDINSASIKARESISLSIAAEDVDTAVDSLRKTLGLDTIKARLFDEKIDDKNRNNKWAELAFTLPRANEPALKDALNKTGKTLTTKVDRNVDKTRVISNAKVEYLVEFLQADSLPARDKVTMKVAAVDVDATYKKLKEVLTRVKGRLTDDDLDNKNRQNINGRLEFDIPIKDESLILDVLAGPTETLERSVKGAKDNSRVSDSKIGYRIELVSAANIQPCETTTLVLEVANVSKTLRDFDDLVKKAEGQSDKPKWSEGSTKVVVEYTVPLAAASDLQEKFRAGGVERIFEPISDPQAPNGKLAKARFTVTLSSQSLLSRDDGLTSQLRQGMQVSLKGLFKSFSWVLAGLLFVGPWLPVAFVIYLVARRTWRSGAVPMVAAAPVVTPESVPGEGNEPHDAPPAT